MPITPLDMQAFNRLTGRSNAALDNVVASEISASADILKRSGALDAARPMVQNVKQALEPAQQIIEGAKTLMSDPLRYLSSAASKAIPAAIAASASLQYTGGQGSFANFLQPISIKTKFFEVDASRNAFIGSPLHSTRTLSTLTGFCKCADVKLELPGSAIEPPATIDELQIVKRYLETGFYIE